MPDNPDHAVEVTDHLWIEMPDGVRLAARLWRPAGTGPVPAILEYIPYRKADMVRARDARNHPFFATHGYACIRVDMRGSGDSEGHMGDMYAQAELDDARHVIDWLAAQPWCNGRVGMFGTSWGGTASLQASVGAPEALKAVIAVCATHDRYTDDIHHMGGCVLTDTIEWGATLPAILASPPTPHAGPDWQTLWRDRIEALEFPLARWLREDGRGAYWRHGSVIHQAGALDVPILAIGGWSDRYSNSVMSLAAARPDLVWGIVGPWGHHYPDHGHPGPGIGFQAQALAWWDAWLGRGRAPDWPRLQVWLREHEPPADAIEHRAGAWAQSGTAQEVTTPRVLHFTGNELGDIPSGGPWTAPLDLAIGQASGDTGYFGRHGGLPLDQAQDDAQALVFETPPLDADMVLYGVPVVHLSVGTRAPTGQVALRLSDVSPRGVSARITWGVRNLALDDALDNPLAPGGHDVEIALPTTAWRVRKGHRLRLALSASCWPLVWPAPDAAPVSIDAGRISLSLLSGPPAPLAEPLPAPVDLPVVKTHRAVAAPPLARWNTQRDGQQAIGWHQPFCAVHYHETGTTFGFETRAEHRIDLADHHTAVTAIAHHLHYDRTDGTADVRAQVQVQTEDRAFRIDASLEVRWNGELFAERQWQISVPRAPGVDRSISKPGEP